MGIGGGGFTTSVARSPRAPTAVTTSLRQFAGEKLLKSATTRPSRVLRVVTTAWPLVVVAVNRTRSPALKWSPRIFRGAR
jgi:hypothetical protein